MKILCTGDAHLGRRPSRIPDTPEQFSVRHVWLESVKWAVDHGVDAVVLTGDMADNKNSYFEAYSALKRGVNRLVDQHIPVYAVAGNHDFDVFPRLMNDLQAEGLTLLGAHGTWSSDILKTKSGEELCFVGWSFPGSHYSSSPLTSFSSPNADIPVVGVVHGDLDGGQSAYAPLSSTELQQQPVDVWLLGHVHAPSWITGAGASILYPGSLQALDPGETGTHGPWVVTIEHGKPVMAEQLPLATVRYEPVDIDVSALPGMDQVESKISRDLQRRTEELSQMYPALGRVIYRPELSGRSSLYRELKKRKWSELMQFEPEAGTLRGSVDRVIPTLKPNRDLQEIAGFGDPPAVLAQWLIDLKSQPVSEELHSEALKAVNQVFGARTYATLRDGEPAPEYAARLLTEQGELLLDELMSQKVHE